MAQPQEEEGWPLRSQLQPLNARVATGSVSFNTLLTASPTCSESDSSSGLDTESTGSFFHDKSITLGSLIGASSILELSRKSTRGKKKIKEPVKEKKGCGSKPWLFSLCAKDPVRRLNNNAGSGPSLGHFLAVERRSHWTQQKLKPENALP
ncbi:unnamed protein product [Linum tenue]|uniref:Uncharacterized protein n=1 Tax=Linum tenue TaxID=586396 RepID=A0AAV0PXK7_9ROSI|nr:unnamed protein product [Linum tenue]